jgi:hypothetical protein
VGFFDLVFMQRPHTEAQLNVAKMVKMNCKPLWVDYDDDLSAVPLSNPAHKAYEKASSIVDELIGLADVVTTTTQHLKRKFEKLNPETQIIPNAFNDHMINYRPELGPMKKLISWRGSPTHQKDVASFTPEILRLAEEYPDWTWCFIGESYWGLIEQMPKDRCVVRHTMDLPAYWHFMQKLGSSVHIVPLDDCPLNRAKSNISWIEGSYAGAVCVVPDWEEWRQEGTVRYQDPEGFYQAMRHLLAGKVDLRGTAAGSWHAIQSNYSLKSVNHSRVELINQLSKPTLFQREEPGAQAETQAPRALTSSLS